MDQSDDMEEDVVELVGCVLDRAVSAHENEKEASWKLHAGL